MWNHFLILVKQGKAYYFELIPSNIFYQDFCLIKVKLGIHHSQGIIANHVKSYSHISECTACYIINSQLQRSWSQLNYKLKLVHFLFHLLDYFFYQIRISLLRCSNVLVLQCTKLTIKASNSYQNNAIQWLMFQSLRFYHYQCWSSLALKMLSSLLSFLIIINIISLKQLCFRCIFSGFYPL